MAKSSKKVKSMKRISQNSLPEQKRETTNMMLNFEGLDMPEFKEPIEILAWSWGAYCVEAEKEVRGDNVKTGSYMQDISMTKWIGLESPKLISLVMKIKKIPTVIFTVKSPVHNFTIRMKMKNVQVTSVSTGGSGGEMRLTENISLSFKSLEIENSLVLENDKTIKSSEVFG